MADEEDWDDFASFDNASGKVDDFSVESSTNTAGADVFAVLTTADLTPGPESKLASEQNATVSGIPHFGGDGDNVSLSQAQYAGTMHAGIGETENDLQDASTATLATEISGLQEQTPNAALSAGDSDRNSAGPSTEGLLDGSTAEVHGSSFELHADSELQSNGMVTHDAETTTPTSVNPLYSGLFGELKSDAAVTHTTGAAAAVDEDPFAELMGGTTPTLPMLAAAGGTEVDNALPVAGDSQTQPGTPLAHSAAGLADVRPSTAGPAEATLVPDLAHLAAAPLELAYIPAHAGIAPESVPLPAEVAAQPEPIGMQAAEVSSAVSPGPEAAGADSSAPLSTAPETQQGAASASVLTPVAGKEAVVAPTAGSKKEDPLASLDEDFAPAMSISAPPGQLSPAADSDADPGGRISGSAPGTPVPALSPEPTTPAVKTEDPFAALDSPRDSPLPLTPGGAVPPLDEKPEPHVADAAQEPSVQQLALHGADGEHGWDGFAQPGPAVSDSLPGAEVAPTEGGSAAPPASQVAAVEGATSSPVPVSVPASPAPTTPAALVNDDAVAFMDSPHDAPLASPKVKEPATPLAALVNDDAVAFMDSPHDAPLASPTVKEPATSLVMSEDEGVVAAISLIVSAGSPPLSSTVAGEEETGHNLGGQVAGDGVAQQFTAPDVGTAANGDAETADQLVASALDQDLPTANTTTEDVSTTRPPLEQMTAQASAATPRGAEDPFAVLDNGLLTDTAAPVLASDDAAAPLTPEPREDPSVITDVSETAAVERDGGAASSAVEIEGNEEANFSTPSPNRAEHLVAESALTSDVTLDAELADTVAPAESAGGASPGARGTGSPIPAPESPPATAPSTAPTIATATPTARADNDPYSSPDRNTTAARITSEIGTLSPAPTNDQPVVNTDAVIAVVEEDGDEWDDFAAPSQHAVWGPGPVEAVESAGVAEIAPPAGELNTDTSTADNAGTVGHAYAGDGLGATEDDVGDIGDLTEPAQAPTEDTATPTLEEAQAVSPTRESQARDDDYTGHELAVDTAAAPLAETAPAHHDADLDDDFDDFGDFAAPSPDPKSVMPSIAGPEGAAEPQHDATSADDGAPQFPPAAKAADGDDDFEDFGDFAELSQAPEKTAAAPPTVQEPTDVGGTEVGDDDFGDFGDFAQPPTIATEETAAPLPATDQTDFDAGAGGDEDEDDDEWAAFEGPSTVAGDAAPQQGADAFHSDPPGASAPAPVFGASFDSGPAEVTTAGSVGGGQEEDEWAAFEGGTPTVGDNFGDFADQPTTGAAPAFEASFTAAPVAPFAPFDTSPAARDTFGAGGFAAFSGGAPAAHGRAPVASSTPSADFYSPATLQQMQHPSSGVTEDESMKYMQQLPATLFNEVRGGLRTLAVRLITCSVV
jgi:hypothetical protein